MPVKSYTIYIYTMCVGFCSISYEKLSICFDNWLQFNKSYIDVHNSLKIYSYSPLSKNTQNISYNIYAIRIYVFYIYILLLSRSELLAFDATLSANCNSRCPAIYSSKCSIWSQNTLAARKAAKIVWIRYVILMAIRMFVCRQIDIFCMHLIFLFLTDWGVF